MEMEHFFRAFEFEKQLFDEWWRFAVSPSLTHAYCVKWFETWGSRVCKGEDASMDNNDFLATTEIRG